MPELAEVEVVRRNLVEWWEGRGASQVRILDRKLNEGKGGERLEEVLVARMVRAGRRGKYLFCEMESGDVVVFHFRMTGKIVVSDHREPRFARLAWLVDEVGWLVFKDQRRFGDVEVYSAEEFGSYEPLARMGPEPGDLRVEGLRAKISDRKMVKAALLDQSVVAGVGNIAVTELFWRCRINPRAKGGDLSAEQWTALVEDMPRYFEEVIERSMADEIDYLGAGGEVENIFALYGREGEGCPRCGAAIEKIKVAGRSSYFCPVCQG